MNKKTGTKKQIICPIRKHLWVTNSF